MDPILEKLIYFPYAYAEFGPGTQEYQALNALEGEAWDNFLDEITRKNLGIDIRYDNIEDKFIIEGAQGIGKFYGTPLSKEKEEFIDEPGVEELGAESEEVLESIQQLENLTGRKVSLKEKKEKFVDEFEKQITGNIVKDSKMKNSIELIKSPKETLEEIDDVEDECLECNLSKEECEYGLEPQESNIKKLKLDKILNDKILKNEDIMSDKNKEVIQEAGDDDKRISTAFAILAAAKKALEEANSQLVINLGYHFQKLYEQDLTEINNTIESARKQIEILAKKIRVQLKR
jgi:hypothetical protein